MSTTTTVFYIHYTLIDHGRSIACTHGVSYECYDEANHVADQFRARPWIADVSVAQEAV